MRILEIKIKNWAKHNPRADKKKHSWFKMSNDFFTDPEFYRASLEARMLWIFALSAASKKADDIIKLNTQMAADSLNVRVEAIDYALNELIGIGCLKEANHNEINLRATQTQSGALEEDIRIEEEKNRIEEDTRNSIPEILEDPKKNLSKKDSQENLKGDFCQTVITILNSICDAKYPVTPDYCALINARKLDGYSLEDFKSVIAFRQSTWATDPKMRQWLRPETLFGTKFYTYLEQSRNPIKSKLSGNPYLEEVRQKYGDQA